MKKSTLSKTILGTLLVGFVLINLVTQPLLVKAESEPNDSFATADPIDVGLSNAEVGATLTTNDYDYYSFTAVAGRTYVFETYDIQGTGSGSATGLFLYDNSQSEIANDRYGNNGTGNVNSRIIHTFSTTGNYYLLVKDDASYNWAGTYSLRILPKHDEPGAAWNLSNDNEPNDVHQLANQILVGLTNAQTHQLFNHASYVTGNSDHDYYYFTAQANQTYVIETFNIQGGSHATGLWLYDSSGSLIKDDRYGRDGSGNVNARIIHTFSTTGIYYVLVKNDASYNWTGTYSLRILPKHDEPGADWATNNDYEPNDVLELANEIQTGLSNSQTHQLFNHSNYVTANSDYDYYHFNAQAGETYVIETYNIQGTGSGHATALYLYNDSGSAIADDRYGSKGTGNVNARIVHTFSTTGTYYVLVKDDASYNWTGTYSLRILPKFDEPGAAWDGNNEPNDVMELANNIMVGAENGQSRHLFDHSNYVTADSDYDFYRFTAVAGTTYVIQTHGIQATSRATGLWLYNDSGTELKNDRYGDNNTGTAVIEYTFSTSGEYFILVKDAQSANWTGSYSVRVCPNSCSQQLFLPMIIK